MPIRAYKVRGDIASSDDWSDGICDDDAQLNSWVEFILMPDSGERHLGPYTVELDGRYKDDFQLSVDGTDGGAGGWGESIEIDDVLEGGRSVWVRKRNVSRASLYLPQHGIVASTIFDIGPVLMGGRANALIPISGFGITDVTLIDSFDSGDEGELLSNMIWTLSPTSPQNCEYDDTRSKTGSQSAFFRGPATATYAGMYESTSAGMTGRQSEVRFWIYFDTANQHRTLSCQGLAEDAELFIRWNNIGLVETYVNNGKSVTGYPTAAYVNIGTYEAGWMQYRLVYNFTNQTYKFGRRAALGDPWTYLKAAAAVDNNIPMRGTNTHTQSHGLKYMAYQNTNFWLDDVRYANAGLADHDIAMATISGRGSDLVSIIVNGPVSIGSLTESGSGDALIPTAQVGGLIREWFPPWGTGGPMQSAAPSPDVTYSSSAITKQDAVNSVGFHMEIRFGAGSWQDVGTATLPQMDYIQTFSGTISYPANATTFKLRMVNAAHTVVSVESHEFTCSSRSGWDWSHLAIGYRCFSYSPTYHTFYAGPNFWLKRK